MGFRCRVFSVSPIGDIGAGRSCRSACFGAVFSWFFPWLFSRCSSARVVPRKAGVARGEIQELSESVR